MDELSNFRKTVKELKQYLSLPVANNRDVAGIIQAFEFTFEQSWKAIQRIAAHQGVEIGNPKSAFSYAMQNKWVATKDEEKWLKLLQDRNLTTQTYKEDLAKEILGCVSGNYLKMFEGLLQALEKA